jgi:hypothetical protein
MCGSGCAQACEIAQTNFFCDELVLLPYVISMVKVWKVDMNDRYILGSGCTIGCNLFCVWFDGRR